MQTPTATWHLKRSCRLTPRQALAAWAVPVTWLTGIAVVAASQGKGWITLLALINIAALVAALSAYARHARDGDTLWLSADGMLHIEQQCGTRRRTTVWRASMVRVDAAAGEPITLRAGRERLQIGAEAAATQRELMVRQLRRALNLPG
jgi:uncharacterized membrane protein